MLDSDGGFQVLVVKRAWMNPVDVVTAACGKSSRRHALNDARTRKALPQQPYSD
jgi:hypothetical protein